MKVRRVLLSCVMGMILAVGIWGQTGRGAVCGDGDEWTRHAAEEEAIQWARIRCNDMFGTLYNIRITSSECSFYDYDCRATACGNCVPY